MWGWTHSPIWDCATIVDFRSQSGENGSPSSASLSPCKYSKFLSKNNCQSLFLEKHSPPSKHMHTTHCTNTFAAHIHTTNSTLLSTGFWPPFKCFWVSFSLFICHKQMRCGVRRQCSLEKLFNDNSYPERQRSCEGSCNNNSTDNENNMD